MLVVFSLAGVAKASLLSLSYRLLLWWADVLCVCHSFATHAPCSIWQMSSALARRNSSS